MLDLSKYAEDKDTYISSTQIKSDFTKFKVIYASGREEDIDFSIHNYQVYLYRMEEQFYTYLPKYNNEVSSEIFKEFKNALIFSLLDIIGMVFTCCNDFSFVTKVLALIVGGIALVSNISRVATAYQVANNKAMKSAVIKAYLEHKEDFAVEIDNPINNQKEKWYVIDLNNVDQFNSVFELSIAAMPLQIPELKEMLTRDLNDGLKEKPKLSK